MVTNNEHTRRTPPHFDILRRERDGSFLWIEAAHDLDLAKARMQELVAAVPGEYFVFDQRGQEIVAKMAADTANR